MTLSRKKYNTRNRIDIYKSSLGNCNLTGMWKTAQMCGLSLSWSCLFSLKNTPLVRKPWHFPMKKIQILVGKEALSLFGFYPSNPSENHLKEEPGWWWSISERPHSDNCESKKTLKYILCLSSYKNCEKGQKDEIFVDSLSFVVRETSSVQGVTAPKYHLCTKKQEWENGKMVNFINDSTKCFSTVHCKIEAKNNKQKTTQISRNVYSKWAGSCIRHKREGKAIPFAMYCAHLNCDHQLSVTFIQIFSHFPPTFARLTPLFLISPNFKIKPQTFDII